MRERRVERGGETISLTLESWGLGGWKRFMVDSRREKDMVHI